MINKIILNDNLMIELLVFTRTKRNSYKFKLENGDIISRKDINEIKYHCVDCDSKTTSKNIKMQYFTDKQYRCLSCCSSGSRNPFFGKSHTEEVKNKLKEERKGTWGVGDKNAMYGKSIYDVWVDKFGVEVADKKYKEMIINKSNSVIGEKNHFYGKTHTPENIEKIKNANKTYLKNLSQKEKKERKNKFSKVQKEIKDKNPDYYKKIKTKAGKMSHVSQFSNVKMNKIEKIVYDYLQKNNIDVKFSLMLSSYQFDFGIKDKRILIEVDGDYWHGNPLYYNKSGRDNKKKLNEIQLKKIKQDKEKTDWAFSHGFTLIRIWETEIINETFKNKLQKIICN